MFIQSNSFVVCTCQHKYKWFYAIDVYGKDLWKKKNRYAMDEFCPWNVDCMDESEYCE